MSSRTTARAISVAESSSVIVRPCETPDRCHPMLTVHAEHGCRSCQTASFRWTLSPGRGFWLHASNSSGRTQTYLFGDSHQRLSERLTPRVEIRQASCLKGATEYLADWSRGTPVLRLQPRRLEQLLLSRAPFSSPGTVVHRDPTASHYAGNRTTRRRSVECRPQRGRSRCRRTC